jgi:hypothetical protein
MSNIAGGALAFFGCGLGCGGLASAILCKDCPTAW